MQALLERFITQSTVYSLMAVLLVAFLESLALVGLDSTRYGADGGLGALIGSGELSFWYPAGGDYWLPAGRLDLPSGWAGVF